MKKLFRFTALLLMSSLCGALHAADEQPRGELLARIVAVVNDDVIQGTADDHRQLGEDAHEEHRQARGDGDVPVGVVARLVAEVPLFESQRHVHERDRTAPG